MLVSPGSVQPLLVIPLHAFIKQAGNRSNSILRLSIKKPCYNSYPRITSWVNCSKGQRKVDSSNMSCSAATNLHCIISTVLSVRCWEPARWGELNNIEEIKTSYGWSLHSVEGRTTVSMSSVFSAITRHNLSSKNVVYTFCLLPHTLTLKLILT